MLSYVRKLTGQEQEQWHREIAEDSQVEGRRILVELGRQVEVDIQLEQSILVEQVLLVEQDSQVEGKVLDQGQVGNLVARGRLVGQGSLVAAEEQHSQVEERQGLEPDIQVEQHIPAERACLVARGSPAEAKALDQQDNLVEGPCQVVLDSQVEVGNLVEGPCQVEPCSLAGQAFLAERAFLVAAP